MRAGLLFLLLACTGSGPTAERPVRVVLVHQPMGGAPGGLDALLDGFRATHPGVELVSRVIPSSSDVAHQYLLTALEGGSDDVDVMVVDVVWVAEFARAGWAMDLSADFPPRQLEADMVPGAAAAVIVDGKTRAVPWYVDVGLLYYRTDLVERPPRTYAELAGQVDAVKAEHPAMRGFLWQGRQYEGLLCVVYELVWGHGGAALGADGRLALDTPAARRALATLRGFVASGVSPPAVTSAAEEEARRVFQSGQSVFMRNWPYAWAELQRPGSPVRGKVGVAALPSADGAPGPGTLGGWQLAVSSASQGARRAAAVALVKHLTSVDAQVALAVAHGRNPARTDAYRSPVLAAEAPFIASLEPMVARARPRPLTPYYPALSDVLQGEFSAAVVGVRSPAEALERAQARADHLMGRGR